MDTIRPSAPSDAWYVQPSAIDRWFCGVFEGGGAKGIAYTGALLALRELRGWFGAVAGASVGAITATLVAAGLTPEEIAAETDSALDRVRTGPWKRIGRLKASGGYYPSDGLTQWLDQLLLTRVGRATSPDPRTRVTFGELHKRTGIELNIVAADLSLCRQIVFSHHQTPECSVADAVAASSAIPFAFESRLLAVREPRAPGGFAHHTIVDGGVWSNFPMFVFEDAAFRALYTRTPPKIDPKLIVGFLLDESQGPPVTRGEDKELQFSSQRGDQVVHAQWLEPAAAADARPVPMGWRILTWTLWPFALLGRALELNGHLERGRWPEPRSRLLQNLLSALNGLSSGLYAYMFAPIIVVALALGAWQMVTLLGQEGLRVPLGWTVPPEMRHKVIKDAREATLGKVAALIAGEATPGDLAGV